MPLFGVGKVIDRPAREAATVKVSQSDDLVTGIAGAALWGPLLDRLGVVAEADRRGLRPIGPGGYTGGECYRALLEVILAGGDVVSDRSLLAGVANERLRGEHRLPSQWTLWRFGDGADLGRAQKAAAVNRTMLARGWALGAGPQGGLVTLDPDATCVATYGLGKEGSTFSYKGQTGLSPMVGVVGETGDVVAVRARAGNAHPGRAMASFVRECYWAIPAAVRDSANVWVRIDSAGYQIEVIDVCAQLGAAFTITAPNKQNVRAAIEALATNPATVWRPALGTEGERGSEVAETTIVIGARNKSAAKTRHLRLIVRRQPSAQRRLRVRPRPVLELLRQLAVVAHLRPRPQHQPVAPGARSARRVPPLPSQTLAVGVLLPPPPRRPPPRHPMAAPTPQPPPGRRLPRSPHPPPPATRLRLSRPGVTNTTPSDNPGSRLALTTRASPPSPPRQPQPPREITPVRHPSQRPHCTIRVRDCCRRARIRGARRRQVSSATCGAKSKTRSRSRRMPLGLRNDSHPLGEQPGQQPVFGDNRVRQSA